MNVSGACVFLPFHVVDVSRVKTLGRLSTSLFCRLLQKQIRGYKRTMRSYESIQPTIVPNANVVGEHEMGASEVNFVVESHKRAWSTRGTNFISSNVQVLTLK